jgi:hypothetical protein
MRPTASNETLLELVRNLQARVREMERDIYGGTA